MSYHLSIHRDVYKDSVELLAATRAMQAEAGIFWAAALMATGANRSELLKAGFSADLSSATANDLVLCVRADKAEHAKLAVAKAEGFLFAPRRSLNPAAVAAMADLPSALEHNPATNFAVISVPGAYAVLEAQKALSAGLNVFIFSDGVAVEGERALKHRAAALGLLVMGPEAGTGRIAGAGLGFCNRLDNGPVGVVAASGTGAQEVACLLDRFDIGVSHIIGIGGRDLSDEIGGLGAEAAIRALDEDPGTEIILLITKPPSPKIMARVLTGSRKPMVAVIIGTTLSDLAAPDHVSVHRTLEEGAIVTVRRLGCVQDRFPSVSTRQLAAAIDRLDPRRTRLVGLFSGGTLCQEAITILTPLVGILHSNCPIDPDRGLETALPGAHLCLDLGEGDYTRGRPHPIIDAAARLGEIDRHAAEADVAVLLLDVVLGDGAHPDPAAVLAPALESLARAGAGVVVHLLGTPRDPQGLARQRARLEDAGCLVAESAARAALAAAALLRREIDVSNLAPPFEASLKTEHLCPPTPHNDYET